MINDINLNLYKVFYNVAISGSFKEATEKLCVSQPAISKQIKNLEEDLGVKLFYRFNKGIELTNEGKILFKQIEKMNFYLEASMKCIDDSKNLLTGELTIGCPSHITSFYLLKFIEKFRSDYKNVKIKVVSDSTSVLVENLMHHKLDFIIDSYPIEVYSKEIVIKKIETFDTIFIASNDYKCEIKNVYDLKDKNLILPLPRSSMRKSLMKSLSEYGVDLNIVLAVDTTDLIISSVKRNLGIGYVIKESVKQELLNKEVKQVDIKCDLPKMELDLVYIKDYLSFPAKKFLKEYIKAI